MRHFKIINDNSNLEAVSINTLNTLYNIVHNNTLDNMSNLKGNVSVSYYYEEYINEIRTKYSLFTVNTLDYYVLFADANAKKKSINDWGDGIGVIANNVNDTYLYETFSKDKMVNYYGEDSSNWKITSYNELSKFQTIIKLDTSVFNSQSYLTSVNLKNIKQLGSYNFYNCMSLTNLGDTSSITSISGTYNFANCTSLTSVDFPSLIGTLGNNSFEGCTSLQTVNIPNITKIGERCFRGCTSLASVDITNCTTIEWYAFQGCTSLTLPSLDFSNITKIEGAVFHGCTSLGLNQNLDYDVSNVEVLGANAFRATGFKNVTLHSNKNLQIDGFPGSGQLGVFSGMPNMLKFDLSDTKFTQFIMQASYYCSVLTTVILPKTLDNLPLFLGDLSGAMLYLIILATTPPTVPTYDSYYTFNGVSSNFAMYVPDEAYESYRSADAWSKYPASRIKKISELPSEITWYTKEHPNDNYHVN